MLCVTLFISILSELCRSEWIFEVSNRFLEMELLSWKGSLLAPLCLPTFSYCQWQGRHGSYQIYSLRCHTRSRACLLGKRQIQLFANMSYGQRSWVIARGKSVATRSMVMFKTWNLLFQIVRGRTISRATGRATLRPVVPPIGCSLTL